MHLRRTLRIGAATAPALAALLAAGGCYSPSSGSGAQGVTSSATSAGPSGTLLGGAGHSGAATASSAAGGSGSGGGSGNSHTTAPATTHTSTKSSASHTPSPAPTVLPALVSITYSTPGCTSNSGTSTVVITWKSKYATEVYLGESDVAFYSDPRSSGGTGPLPPNGSQKMPFNCANQYDYFMLGVYNSVGKTGETQQVPNPAY